MKLDARTQAAVIQAVTDAMKQIQDFNVSHNCTVDAPAYDIRIDSVNQRNVICKVKASVSFTGSSSDLKISSED